MPIMKWDPFKDLLSIQERMNRLFEAALSRSDVAELGDYSAWSPLADVYEIEEGLVISMELPGIIEDDIDISMSGDTLSIRGERKMDKEVQKESYHRIERAYGSFSRHFNIPPGMETGKVSASFKDGILTISIPRKEASKPKKIKIQVD